MKYRNTVTGAVIESTSVISGGNWVEETPPKAPSCSSTGKKKNAAKKSTK